jgi:hypothetical protein
MKAVVLVGTFALMAGVFCGGGPTPQAPKPKAAIEFPSEATGLLTDAEMATFVKALPELSASLRAASWQPAQPEAEMSPVAGLSRFIESMNVPGVEEALKKVGADWKSIRPALYKIYAASAALNLEAASAWIEELKKDTSAEAKKGLRQMEEMKQACSKVPDANKQLVVKNSQDLQALQTLGQ